MEKDFQHRALKFSLQDRSDFTLDVECIVITYLVRLHNTFISFSDCAVVPLIENEILGDLKLRSLVGVSGVIFTTGTFVEPMAETSKPC